jgi:hypothetical protein
VLLLGGWLLMTPPTDTVNGLSARGLADPIKCVKRDAPVTQWVQTLATDTARACEKAKQEQTDLYEHTMKAMKDKKQTPFPPELLCDLWASQEARCVPAEHIYPPAKAKP